MIVADFVTSCVGPWVGHVTGWAPEEVSFPWALTWKAGQWAGPVGSARDWGNPHGSALSWADAAAEGAMMLTVPFH